MKYLPSWNSVELSKLWHWLWSYDIVLTTKVCRFIFVNIILQFQSTFSANNSTTIEWLNVLLLLLLYQQVSRGPWRKHTHILISIYINYPMAQQLMRARVLHRMLASRPFLRISELSSPSSGMSWGQHVPSLSCCWLSRSRLPLQISSCSSYSWCLAGTDPIQ